VGARDIRLDQALGEIVTACQARNLPALPAIVARYQDGYPMAHPNAGTFTDIVLRVQLTRGEEERLAAEIHAPNIASADRYEELLENNGCRVELRDDLSEEWKRILVDRLAMYRSLRDTTIAKFGEARFLEYDRAYSHFVGLFAADKLGGVRIVAQHEA
jgi:hypothetical protein